MNKPFLEGFQPLIHCTDRHKLNGHKSGLVFLTGLSGSGKSTLAHAVEANLYEHGIRSYVLDGDNIRGGLNSDLGLSPEHRKENIRRIGEVAKIMVDAGILTLAAFIAPYRESRSFLRELMQGLPYYEIFIKCPLDVCEKRDVKGLYRLARAGKITNMTGISAPYEEPDNPDFVVDTCKLTLEQSVKTVVGFMAMHELIVKK